MTQVVRGVLSIIEGFSTRDRKDFVQGLVASGALTKDQQDIVVIESRRNGRTRPLSKVLMDLKRKGRIR